MTFEKVRFIINKKGVFMKQETKTVLLIVILILSITLVVLDACRVIDNFIPFWLLRYIRRVIKVL